MYTLFLVVAFETTKRLTEKPTEATTFENTQHNEGEKDEGQFYPQYSNPGSKTTYSWSSSNTLKISLTYMLAFLMIVMHFVWTNKEIERYIY